MKRGLNLLLALCCAVVLLAGPAVAGVGNEIGNFITVAKSGGEYTSIQAAIDAATPTADSPVVVMVYPGTYVEAIQMKSYVSLQGAGFGEAIVQSPGHNLHTITVDNCAGVAISSLKLVSAFDTSQGIFVRFSHVILRNNTIDAYKGVVTISGSVDATGNTIYNTISGFELNYNGPKKSNVSNNVISGRSTIGSGVTLGSVNADISDNIISGFVYGIGVSFDSSAIAKNNVLTNNRYGANFYSCDPTISSANIFVGNVMTNNQYGGVKLGPDCHPNISHNILDSIDGIGAVGQYNVSSSGAVVDVP